MPKQLNHLQEIEKSFLTKKRIILLIISMILVGVLLFLNFKFVIKVDWNSFGSSISKSFSANPLASLFFTGLFTGLIFSTICCYLTISMRLKDLKIKTKFGEMLFFSLVMGFTNFVTPGGLIRMPYTMFYLTTKGANNVQATSIVVSNEILSMLGWVISCTPGFIYILASSNNLISGKQTVLLVLIIVGYIWDLLTLLGIIFIGFSTRIQYASTLAFNWIKKILRLHYYTKNEIKHIMHEEAIMRKLVNQMIRNYKTSITVLVSSVLINFINGLLPVFAFALICYGTDYIENVKGVNTYFVMNGATLANRIAFIIPARTGSLELAIKELCTIDSLNPIIYKTGISVSEKMTDTYVGNSLLVWRCAYSYLPALIGLPLFIILFIKQLKTFEVKKIDNDKNKSQTKSKNKKDKVD
ncbi:MAG: hypothetical protein Ta2E_05570 [Mycoplasmoidaceae bacterium]|nr:MAG: hypothetical protein Ta2E_05570 [Mycoplasmoidaceae bacterium]